MNRDDHNGRLLYKALWGATAGVVVAVGVCVWVDVEETLAAFVAVALAAIIGWWAGLLGGLLWN